MPDWFHNRQTQTALLDLPTILFFFLTLTICVSLASSTTWHHQDGLASNFVLRNGDGILIMWLFFALA